MQPFQLRLATAADAPPIHAIYAPIVRETPISFELDPPAVDEIGTGFAVPFDTAMPSSLRVQHFLNFVFLISLAGRAVAPARPRVDL